MSRVGLPLLPLHSTFYEEKNEKKNTAAKVDYYKRRKGISLRVLARTINQRGKVL